MARLLQCPQCGQESIGIGQSEPECSECGAQFRLEVFCPHCDASLERLKACGAVDFFCNHCQLLISKQEVKCCLQRLER